MYFILAFLLAYLLGSLSTAIIIAKLFHLPDPRSQGSNNAGATNVLRISGKKPAIFVLIGDCLKGLVSVLMAAYIFKLQGSALAFIGFAAVLGHIFPIFFNFRGGKGVATALGVLLALSVWITLILVIIWLTLVFFTRYVSLASIITTICAPLLMLISGHAHYTLPLFCIALMIVWKHWGNILRLRKGQENKLRL